MANWFFSILLKPTLLLLALVSSLAWSSVVAEAAEETLNEEKPVIEPEVY